jgi:hypothetical protein
MILKYADIKKRLSSFIYDLLTYLPNEVTQEVLNKNEQILTFDLTINGIRVDLELLELMYKKTNEMIDVRAKYKAIKMLSDLKIEISEIVCKNLLDSRKEVDKLIIKYIDDSPILKDSNLKEEDNDDYDLNDYPEYELPKIDEFNDDDFINNEIEEEDEPNG